MVVAVLPRLFFAFVGALLVLLLCAAAAPAGTPEARARAIEQLFLRQTPSLLISMQ